MSISMFANALRTHSRLRVLTASRLALPATRSISSWVVFRTAVPKNVSLAVSRSFTTSQVARNGYEDESSRSPATNTVFLANLPWSATEEDIIELFSEFGKVTSVRIHMNGENRPRGIAHCEFATKESAIAAIESAAEEPIHLAGRDLRVDFSAGNRAQSVAEPSEKLYFAGCAGDENEIRNLFRQFGDSIVDIFLLKDAQTGDRLPTGFVELKNTEIATEALEALNGTQTPYGETLSVSYARKRRFQSNGFSDKGARRGGSSGGYGGGSYGGGGGGNFGGNRGGRRSSSSRY